MDLKVAIMSRGPRLYSTRRLVEEAKKRNLEVEVTDPMKFSLLVDDGKIEINYMGMPLSLIHI